MQTIGSYRFRVALHTIQAIHYNYEINEKSRFIDLQLDEELKLHKTKVKE
jgi:hypothetical protein